MSAGSNPAGGTAQRHIFEQNFWQPGTSAHPIGLRLCNKAVGSAPHTPPIRLTALTPLQVRARESNGPQGRIPWLQTLATNNCVLLPQAGIESSVRINRRFRQSRQAGTDARPARPASDSLCARAETPGRRSRSSRRRSALGPDLAACGSRRVAARGHGHSAGAHPPQFLRGDPPACNSRSKSPNWYG